MRRESPGEVCVCACVKWTSPRSHIICFSKWLVFVYFTVAMSTASKYEWFGPCFDNDTPSAAVNLFSSSRFSFSIPWHTKCLTSLLISYFICSSTVSSVQYASMYTRKKAQQKCHFNQMLRPNRKVSCRKPELYLFNNVYCRSIDIQSRISITRNSKNLFKAIEKCVSCTGWNLMNAFNHISTHR